MTSVFAAVQRQIVSGGTNTSGSAAGQEYDYCASSPAQLLARAIAAGDNTELVLGCADVTAGVRVLVKALSSISSPDKSSGQSLVERYPAMRAASLAAARFAGIDNHQVSPESYPVNNHTSGQQADRKMKVAAVAPANDNKASATTLRRTAATSTGSGERGRGPPLWLRVVWLDGGRTPDTGTAAITRAIKQIQAHIYELKHLAKEQVTILREFYTTSSSSERRPSHEGGHTTGNFDMLWPVQESGACSSDNADSSDEDPPQLFRITVGSEALPAELLCRIETSLLPRATSGDTDGMTNDQSYYDPPAGSEQTIPQGAINAVDAPLLLRRALKDLCHLQLIDEDGACSNVHVLFVIERFERFADVAKQRTLYTLFDLMHISGIFACFVTMTAFAGTRELLEKRVLSRYTASRIYVTNEVPLLARLSLSTADAACVQGGAERIASWNAVVSTWLADDEVQDSVKEDVCRSSDSTTLALLIVRSAIAATTKANVFCSASQLAKQLRLEMHIRHRVPVDAPRRSLDQRAHGINARRSNGTATWCRSDQPSSWFVRPEHAEQASRYVDVLCGISVIEWAVVGAIRILRDERQRTAATIRSIVHELRTVARFVPNLDLSLVVVAVQSLIKTGLVVSLDSTTRHNKISPYTLLLLDCLKEHIESALQRKESQNIPTALRDWILRQ